MHWSDWTIGSKDNRGEKIHKIHSRRNKENQKFIIYETEDGTVRVTHDEMNMDWGEASIAYSQVLSYFYRDSIRKKYANRVAVAIKVCLETKKDKDIEDPYSNGLEMFNSLIASLERSRTAWGRFEYLLGAAGATGLFALIGLLVNRYFEFDHLVYVYGVLGGLTSVLTGLENVKIDTREGRITLHITSGASRILLSFLSGIIMYQLISSEFIGSAILEMAKNANSMNSLIYTFCFASGFFEKLVPDLLKKTTKAASE